MEKAGLDVIAVSGTSNKFRERNENSLAVIVFWSSNVVQQTGLISTTHIARAGLYTHT